MGAAASVAALQAFGARRIAVLTPHQPRGDEMVRLYLAEAGFEIVRLHGMKCATPRAIAQVPAADIQAALKSLDGPDVDALLQVGTALPTVAIAAEAERWFGKPVLAINAVTYWDAFTAAASTTASTAADAFSRSSSRLNAMPPPRRAS